MAKARKIFPTLFPGLGKFPLDELFLHVYQIRIDIIALDDMLIKKHSDYAANQKLESGGMSMSEFIIKQYGTEAEKFVRNMI